MKRRALIVGSLLTMLFPSVSLAAPRTLPHSEQKAEIRAVGEALESVLRRMGKTYGVSLRASRELKQQRVTLFLQNTDLETIARLLADLLTPTPAASVSWTRSGNGWALEESINRRRLVERLQNQDLELYREHLEAEVAWLRGEEERQTKGETPKEVILGDADTLRRSRTERMALARFFEWMGPEGREKLLSGEPITHSVGKMPTELRKSYYAYLRQTLGSVAGLTDEGVDRYTIAYLLALSPTGNGWTRLIESIITPEGIWRSRASVSGMAQAIPPAFYQPPFTLTPANPEDTSRKVSLSLGIAPEARPGTRVFRNLDELLEEVAKGAGVQVVADGYLRTRRAIPANLRVQDYPLRQLLDRLTRAWNCEWRFVDKDEKTILLRARNWWMEDAADVPEPLLQELHSRLNQKHGPELADVLRLAELSKAQLHKLIEAGFCPDASSLIQPGAYDDTGPKPILQFFNRLPVPLQARMQSPEGLRLGEASPELVQTWLRKTLTACGAIEPNLWASMTLRVEIRSDDTAKPIALLIRLGGPAGEYATWTISPTASEAGQLRMRG